jgi:hypothetical protein
LGFLPFDFILEVFPLVWASHCTRCFGASPYFPHILFSTYLCVEIINDFSLLFVRIEFFLSLWGFSFRFHFGSFSPCLGIALHALLWGVALFSSHVLFSTYIWGNVESCN